MSFFSRALYTWQIHAACIMVVGVIGRGLIDQWSLVFILTEVINQFMTTCL